MPHAVWNALAKGARAQLVFLWSSVSLATVVLLPLGLLALPGESVPAAAVPFVVATIAIHAVYFYALGVTRQEVVHPGRPGESSGCQVITHPDQEAWMNIHKNARLTPYRRQELVARVERGEPVTAVARAFGVSRQTARKWVVRKRDAGVV